MSSAPWSRRQSVTVAVAMALLAGTAVGIIVALGPQGQGGVPCGGSGAVPVVSVDLAQVVSAAGGGLRAEVAVPSLGASHGRGITAGDPYGMVETPLTAAPVEVRVRVTTAAGRTAYTASTTADPVLVSPATPGCDDATYRVDLVAEPGGTLLPT